MTEYQRAGYVLKRVLVFSCRVKGECFNSFMHNLVIVDLLYFLKFNNYTCYVWLSIQNEVCISMQDIHDIAVHYILCKQELATPIYMYLCDVM